MKTFYIVLVSLILFYSNCRSKENSSKNDLAHDSRSFSPQDIKSDLTNLLSHLRSNSNVNLFKLHCSSIIDVINSKDSFIKSELSFLNSMYKQFSDTTLEWNAGKMTTYIQRKRPFILSWKSPFDGKVSVAWLLLPANWDPDKTYPLYVWLHGYYPETENEIQYMTKYFRSDTLMDNSFEDGYTLFPWGRGDVYYEGKGEVDVLESIEAAENMVKTDSTKKYLMGFSMGGYGTWYIGTRHPEQWAGLGIMSGALYYRYSLLTKDNAEKIKNIPVYIVAGDQDGLINDNKTAYNLLVKAGAANLKFVTFHGGHESLPENWVNMYNWLRNFSKDSLTSVNNTILPDQYFLYNNYPNPFNPVTTISYFIPEEAGIRIEIYNLLGQKIITLTDMVETSGYYNVKWDAKNLPGGVYFCKFSAAPTISNKDAKQKVFVKIHKLILLK
jgi:predicted esterase